MLNEGNPKKYLIYAIGEILLVMIGILLALQVNKWNEQRIDVKQRKYYTQSLMEDLRKDTSILNASIATAEEDDRKLMRIAKRLSSPLANEDTFKLVSRTEIVFIYEAYRPPSQNTFSILQSTGKLELFDKEIYNDILDLRIEQDRYESIHHSATTNLQLAIDHLKKIRIPYELSLIKGQLYEENYSTVNSTALFLEFNNFITTKFIVNQYITIARRRVLDNTLNLLEKLENG